MIALIDYGAGNLTSVRKALRSGGRGASTRRRPGRARDGDGIVVPGVGHFARNAGARRRMARRHSPSGRRGLPLLGICLGLQWLFEGSDEAPDCRGSGAECRTMLPASAGRRARRCRMSAGTRCTCRAPPGCFDGVAEGAQVYFTHSLRRAGHRDASPSTTNTGAVRGRRRARHVFGVQFHPEKSGEPACASCRTSSTESLNRSCCPSGIIACLDVRDGCVVKGVNFGDCERGRSRRARTRYNAEGIDEVVDPGRHGDAREPARAGRHDPRGRARAVHPADRRRRHPHPKTTPRPRSTPAPTRSA